MTQTKRLILIHGVFNGDDKAVAGYSKKLTDGIENKFGVRLNDVVETKWASEAQKQAAWTKGVAPLIDVLAGLPVGILINAAIDLVSDVFTYQNKDAAKAIRAKVRKDILNAGGPKNCILAAHSLGTIILHDILREEVDAKAFADKDPKKWPFAGVVTFGSPLNLRMFADQRKAPFKGTIGAPLTWHNICDGNDPIVTGNVLGILDRPLLHDSYPSLSDNLFIKDRFINSGLHLGAHAGYWSHPYLIDKIGRMILS